MHRKHIILPSREPVFARERLLFFRRPKPRIRDFRIDTRAFRATSFVISTAVIWYTVLFRQLSRLQPHFEVSLRHRPIKNERSEQGLVLPLKGASNAWSAKAGQWIPQSRTRPAESPESRCFPSGDQTKASISKSVSMYS